jgi:hypothetical protein
MSDVVAVCMTEKCAIVPYNCVLSPYLPPKSHFIIIQYLFYRSSLIRKDGIIPCIYPYSVNQQNAPISN